MSPAGVARWLRGGPEPLILLGVLAFDVLLFSGFLEPAGRPVTAAGQVGIVAYELVAVLALAVRARHPVAVFALCWVHAVVGAVVVGEITPVMAVLVALAAVSMRRGAWESVPAALATLGAFALVVRRAVEYRPANDTPSIVFGSVLGYAVVVAGAWALGRWRGRTSRRVRELEARREAAVADERARIARELHDIVSSTVTAMAMHAGGARALVRSDPDRVVQALATIQDAGGQAVAELRRMLGLLREPGGGPPTGRIAEIGELAARTGELGVRVGVTVEGVPAVLDPSVELAAYRIVQEALTNAVRHAGVGARAEVTLGWRADRLVVRVADDGAGRPVPGLSTGHGLLGLAERVAVVGGALEHGPDDRHGGYRVEASLPLTREAVGVG